MIDACRVLIVEDEYLLGADLGLALQSEGAEIVGPIFEVADALNQLAHGGFDVAVLDINLHNQTTYPIADKLIERHIPSFLPLATARKLFPIGFGRCSDLKSPTTRRPSQSASCNWVGSVKAQSEIDKRPTLAR